MTIRLTTLSLAILGLAACNRAPDKDVDSNPAIPTPINEIAPATPPEAAPANVALPDDRTPLAETKGPIDPKSAQAAGQVVQHYGALIEDRKFADARALWGDGASADRFRAGLAAHSEIHLEIGKPGDTEGAAGSIYTNVPVIFYGTKKDGGDFRRGANVILRRVNDVPGSTAAQRRWHIERIDWDASP